MFLFPSSSPTDVTVSLYARLLSLAEITREISPQSHTLTANMFLDRITMLLLASPAPTDVIVSLCARPLSHAEITREITPQSHP